MRFRINLQKVKRNAHNGVFGRFTKCSKLLKNKPQCCIYTRVGKQFIKVKNTRQNASHNKSGGSLGWYRREFGNSLVNCFKNPVGSQRVAGFALLRAGFVKRPLLLHSGYLVEAYKVPKRTRFRCRRYGGKIGEFGCLLARKQTIWSDLSSGLTHCMALLILLVSRFLDSHHPLILFDRICLQIRFFNSSLGHPDASASAAEGAIIKQVLDGSVQVTMHSIPVS